MKSLLPAAVVLVVALVGCTDDPGRVLVAVGSDYTIPTELGELVARVSGPDGAEERRSFHLVPPGMNDPAASRFSIPLSFAIVPRGDDSSRGARITIEGYLVDGAPTPRVVARRNVSSFLEGKTLLLPIFLRESCDNVTCDDPNTTCEHGVCVDARTDSRMLEVVTDEGAIDRALDAGPPDDARAADAGPSPRDAATLDAPFAPADASITSASVLGDLADQSAYAVSVAADGTGDLFIAGSYQGTIHVGATPAMPIDTDAFVGRVNSTGAFEWILTLNGDGIDHFTGISSQPDDTNVFVTGVTSSSAGNWNGVAGGVPPVQPGIILMALTPLTGAVHWRSIVPDAPGAEAFDDATVGPAAATLDDRFFVAGRGDAASFDLFGVPIPITRGYLATLHPNGTGVAAQVDEVISLPESDLAADSRMSAVTVVRNDTTMSDEVYVAGYVVAAGGDHQPYVARVDFPDRSMPAPALVVWERADFAAGGAVDDVRGIAVDASAVYVTGIHAPASAQQDVLVAAFSRTGGNILWVREVGGTLGQEYPNALAVDDDGRVWVGGGFFDEVDLGSGFTAPGVAGKDIFLAAYSPSTGAPLELFVYTGDGNDAIRSLAFPPRTRTGYFGGYLSTPFAFAGMSAIGAPGGLTDACYVTFGY